MEKKSLHEKTIPPSNKALSTLFMAPLLFQATILSPSQPRILLFVVSLLTLPDLHNQWMSTTLKRPSNDPPAALLVQHPCILIKLVKPLTLKFMAAFYELSFIGR